MGREIARDRHVGLLVPDPRIELWTAQCAGSQAGPRAGIPVPSTASLLALSATGAQSASSVGVEVRTQRSGFPARQGAYDALAAAVVDRGASFVWRAATGSSTSWKGWDPPRAPADWHVPLWTDGSGNLKYGANPCVVVSQDGAILVIAQVREVSASGGEYRLECIRRTASNSTFTRVLIEGEATAPSANYCPAAVVLPSGRILVYRWRAITSGGTTIYGLRLWYSDDAGLTWSFGGDGVAGRGTTNSIGRTRAAYYGGQVLLLAGNGDLVEQYASADGGLTLQYVGVVDSANPYVAFDVVAGDDGFVIAYLGGATSATDVYTRVLGNAYEAFTTVAENSTPRGSITGDCALCASDSGELYLYYRVGAVLYASYSLDGGRVWSVFAGTSLGQSSIRTGDAGTYIDDLACAWWRGQVVVAHNWTAAPGNEDDSIGVMYFGGYTTLNLPRHRSDASISSTASWDVMWFPWDLPSDSGWTAAGTAATEALETPGLLRLNTTSANTRTYTDTAASLVTATGGGILIDFASVTGGATTTNQRSVLFRLGDGVNSYGVELRIGTAGYRLYDGTAGTIIGGEQTINTLLRTQVMIFLAGSKVTSYHRSVDTTIGGTRTWVVGPTTTALTDGGASSDSIVWGHRDTGGAAAETVFYGFFVADSDAIGRGLHNGLTNPTDLCGRMYAPRGRGVYVTDEVAIQARSGPTVAGEAWTISTEYEYPRSAVTTDQPRRAWRSTAIAETQTIAFRWATVGDTPLDTPLLGIYLANKNLSRVTVSWYDLDTTAWVDAVTYDLHTNLPHTRVGESVIASSDVPALGVVRANEYAGATFEIDDTSREITHHPEGRWATAGVRTVFHLDAVDSGDTSSATGALVPRQALLVLPISARYSGVKITQVAPDSNNPAPWEGYWMAGRVLVGAVYPLADDPSWGRAVEHQGGAEIERTRDRTTRVRNAAPIARVIELAWVDGVDQSGVDGGDPDRVEYGGASASVGGTPAVLAGIQRLTDAGTEQLVYIPRLTVGTAHVLQRRHEAILCRIASPYRAETVQGDEDVDEVIRLGTIVLEEDV
jgi:hypothetical protein